jgi:uncharacterized protein (DUF697 family)
MVIPFFRRGSSPPGESALDRLAPAFAGAPATEGPETAEGPEVVEMRAAGPRRLSCRDKARAMVHKYAMFGTAWAVLPVPIATSAGLTALETHMLYWIARAYGEEPTKSDVVMAAGGLELCSVALKTAAIEGANLVPVIGWGVKAAIAGSAIEAIGNAAILHYEGKYPGKAA